MPPNTPLLQQQDTTPSPTPNQACSHCGAAGAVIRSSHVGGHGQVERRECADVVACWARLDAARGIIGWAAAELARRAEEEAARSTAEAVGQQAA